MLPLAGLSRSITMVPPIRLLRCMRFAGSPTNRSIGLERAYKQQTAADRAQKRSAVEKSPPDPRYTSAEEDAPVEMKRCCCARQHSLTNPRTSL